MDANKHTQFYLDQLEPLVDGVIEDAVRTDGDEFGDEFFGLAIRCKDGEVRRLIILADDEGNGPGSFEIVEGSAMAEPSIATALQDAIVKHRGRCRKVLGMDEVLK